MSTRRVSSTLMMLFVLGSSMNAFAQNNDVLDENFVLDEMWCRLHVVKRNY